MASIDKFLPKLLGHEGGFANVKHDNGGPTNYGVTLKTLQSIKYDKDKDGDIDINDLKNLQISDVKAILKANFWDRWKADGIYTQELAELLVDWHYTSGKWGIIIPQRILEMEFKCQCGIDGIVGPGTLHCVNSVNQEKFFLSVKAARKRFHIDIVKSNPTQKKFLLGWQNRVDKFELIS